MDAAVRDLETITDMAGESREWNEQHSKVGPRDNHVDKFEDKEEER